MGLKSPDVMFHESVIRLLYFYFFLLVCLQAQKKVSLLSSFPFLNFFIVHLVFSLPLHSVFVKIRSFQMQHFLALHMLFLFPHAYTICLCALGDVQVLVRIRWQN